MRKHPFLLPALVLCLAALLLIAPRPDKSPRQVQTVDAPAQSKRAADAYDLFPEIDGLDATRVTITTPSTSFELKREGDQQVSINGRRGDTDVYFTLLEQIADIHCVPTTPFVAQEAPLLTLQVHQDGVLYVARFYDDDAAGQHARIVSDTDGGTLYGITDGWRVGTLLMTCEGTRIQDESGQEMPIE